MSFHVAADIVGTDAEAILRAFEGLPYRTRHQSSDELRIDNDELSFEIYALDEAAKPPKNYLVSGEVDAEEPAARAKLQEIVDSLATHGIKAAFEADKVGNPEHTFTVHHPDLTT